MSADPAVFLPLLGADPATVQALIDLSRRHHGAPTRVVRTDRGAVTVLTVAGEATVADRGATTGRWVTGDWVVLARGAPATIAATLPRRGVLERTVASERSDAQVLAAGVDVALICASLHAPLRPGRVERAIAMVWQGGVTPVVCLTKTDLVDDETVDTVVSEAVRAAPGVEVLLLSTRTGSGLAALAGLAGPGRTLAVIGPSGAGKSSLVNALAGRDAMAVGDVRNADGKGRHTTVTRELTLLPGGGAIIDTPGLRGLALWAAPDGLHRAFSDIEDLAVDCRFNDCRHESEPGCAVLAAVDAGVIDQRRLTSRAKLQREQERLAARVDARMRAERSKELRRWGREMRRQPHR